jgi:Rad3-related DNA helicase
LLTDLRELTSELVLEQFPSPTLRPYQKEIITRTVEAFSNGKRCIILAAPTGFGKSYVNAAFASVAKSFYATPQLALIDQIMADPYLKDGFVEIRGKRNYQCYLNPKRRVHVGNCVTQDYPCRERFIVCPYWISKQRARDASAVLTSLAYLISESQSDGAETYLGSRPLVVLDEAHNLEEQCLNQIAVRVTPFTIPVDLYDRLKTEIAAVKTDTEVKSFLDRVEANLRNLIETSQKIVESSGLTVTQAKDLDRANKYLSTYENYKKSKSDWVWQNKNNQLTLQPVFAKEFMHNLVWKRGENYIISSATILDPEEFEKTTSLLDFLKKDEIEFVTVPSTFPVENRPIIDVTVGPLSAQYVQENMPKAIRSIEEILRRETGNVAIHCHSYQHQHSLVDGISEEFKPRLIVHSSRDREEKLAEWMRGRGKVFVSVAFNEGQDWKYDVCDAQILLKVPFQDLGDPRIKRRLDLGYHRWYENQAMLEVIQAYGRAIRAEDDKARFYILDGSFTRLVHNCWSSIPDWFKDALPESFNLN